MNGTSFSHTTAIDWMPPMMTMAVITANTMPIASGGMSTGLLPRMISEIALICVPQPMPNEASMASSANATPSHLRCRPRSSAYIAPPCMRPSLVCTRYLTAIRL